MGTYLRAHNPIPTSGPPSCEGPHAAAAGRSPWPAGARASILALALAAVGLTAACAPRARVVHQMDRIEQRLDRTATALAAPELDPALTAAALADFRQQVEHLSFRADLALARSREAEAAAQAGLLLETVYVIDEIRFPPGSAALDDRDRSILDQLAERLRVEDAGYYVEVRGYADELGNEEANWRLGEERAEAVRSYLHREKKLPLHHIDAVSRGSKATDEGTPQGRGHNRCAVVVVLRQGS